MVHLHVGKTITGHFVHCPILEKSLAYYIAKEWSSSLCSSPSRSYVPGSYCADSLFKYLSSVYLLMIYILLRAEYVPWMALAMSPKLLFDIHKTLVNIFIVILHNEETKNPADLSQRVLPSEYTQDHPNCPLTQKLSNAVILDPEGPFSIQIHALHTT